MTSMGVKIRRAGKEDIASLCQVYDSFVRQFVGSTARTAKSFSRMLRGKDSMVYVAVDGQNKVIGYVHARVNKRLNRGEFAEIVAEPGQDFESVATLLVERVNVAFIERKVSAIVAGSFRNPVYEKLFPKLGFFDYELTDVFMYSILNVQRLLSELSPVFVSRLQRLKQWNGTVQMECEGHSLFLEKTKEGVEPIVWTNRPPDFKVSLSTELLTKLIFGVTEAREAHRMGQLRIENTNGKAVADKLLAALFPKRQFLIMDHW